MTKLLLTQPNSYGTLLKNSLHLYKRTLFSPVILLGFLLSFVVFFPKLISDLIGENILLTTHRLNIFNIFWPLIIHFIAIIFFIGIMWHIYKVAHKQKDVLTQDISMGLKKFIYVFLAALVQSIIIFFLIILIIFLHHLVNPKYVLFSTNFILMAIQVFLFLIQLFLIIYIPTLFIFFTPLIVTENKGVFGALQKSITLVWNHWWRTISFQLTPWIFYILFLFIIRFVLRIPIRIYLVSNSPYDLWITLLHLIIFALFIPWVAATLLVQLNDLELRKKHA